MMRNEKKKKNLNMLKEMQRKKEILENITTNTESSSH
jgi:hypothetical protein